MFDGSLFCALLVDVQYSSGNQIRFLNFKLKEAQLEQEVKGSHRNPIHHHNALDQIADLALVHI